MTTTTTLLGATGLVLVAAFFLAFAKLQREKAASPEDIEALRREISALNVAHAELSKNNLTFLSTSSYVSNVGTTTPEPSTTAPASEARYEELNAEIAKLRDDLASAQAEPEEPAPDPAALQAAEEEEAEAASRARLISQAILQANIAQWDPEQWFAVIEPSPSANFSIGEVLGVRRNGGILGRLRIDRAAGGQYIASLTSAIGGSAPDIRPGDELIIPPAFDGALD